MSIDSSKEMHRGHEASMSYWKGAFDEAFDDTKRHFEMLNTALPILNCLKPESILTIGDNRGRDAAFFKRFLRTHVIASDLDISKLLPAEADGFIDECKVVDVEDIDFPDDSIDVVVVKESFHHWPRPMLGFYEVLRVAKLGVIFIEPFDVSGDKDRKPYIDAEDFSDSYEEVGNYKYQISLRELIKSTWSLYLDTVVARGFNDPYKPGFAFDNWLEEKKKLDLLGEQGLRPFNLMTIFVEKDRGRLDISSLAGYKVYRRPKNPFMDE